MDPQITQIGADFKKRNAAPDEECAAQVHAKVIPICENLRNLRTRLMDPQITQISQNVTDPQITQIGADGRIADVPWREYVAVHAPARPDSICEDLRNLWTQNGIPRRV